MKKYLPFLILLSFAGIFTYPHFTNAQNSISIDQSATDNLQVTGGATLGNGPTPTATTFTQSTDGSVNPNAASNPSNPSAGGATTAPTPTVTGLPAGQFDSNLSNSPAYGALPTSVTGQPTGSGASVSPTDYSGFVGSNLNPNAAGTNVAPGSSNTGSVTSTLTPAASTCSQTGGNLCYTPLEPLPGVNYTNVITPNGLGPIINTIFYIIIRVGALLAVLMLTIGGVQYMISGTAGGKNQGIARAKAAMWGILLIAASWLILNTINPNLLSFNLTPCPSGVQGVNCGITGTPTPTTPATNTCIGTSCATSDQLTAANAVTCAQTAGCTLTPAQQAALPLDMQINAGLQTTQATGCANSNGQLYNNVSSGANCSSQQAQGNQNSITGYTHCTDVPSGGYCLTP